MNAMCIPILNIKNLHSKLYLNIFNIKFVILYQICRLSIYLNRNRPKMITTQINTIYAFIIIKPQCGIFITSLLAVSND